MVFEIYLFFFCTDIQEIYFFTNKKVIKNTFVSVPIVLPVSLAWLCFSPSSAPVFMRSHLSITTLTPLWYQVSRPSDSNYSIMTQLRGIGYDESFPRANQNGPLAPGLCGMHCRSVGQCCQGSLSFFMGVHSCAIEELLKLLIRLMLIADAILSCPRWKETSKFLRDQNDFVRRLP